MCYFGILLTWTTEEGHPLFKKEVAEYFPLFFVVVLLLLLLLLCVCVCVGGGGGVCVGFFFSVFFFFRGHHLQERECFLHQCVQC